MLKIFSYKTGLLNIKKFNKLDLFLLIIFIIFIMNSPKYYDIKDLNASLEQTPFKRGLVYKIKGNLIYKNNNFYLITKDYKDNYGYRIIVGNNFSKKEFVRLKKKSNKEMTFLLKILNSEKDIISSNLFKLKLIKIL